MVGRDAQIGEPQLLIDQLGEIAFAIGVAGDRNRCLALRLTAVVVVAAGIFAGF
jgi:hypothetical protein